MAKDKKSPKTDAPELQVQTEEIKEIPAGQRGEVGVSTPSSQIKLLWHQEHFVLQDVGNSKNPRKQAYIKHKAAPSLKKYARTLLAQGNEVAVNWYANKAGKLNEKRSDKNKARIALEAQASMSARKKKSQKAPKATATV